MGGKEWAAEFQQARDGRELEPRDVDQRSPEEAWSRRWRNRRGGSECRGLELRTSWEKWMINDFFDERDCGGKKGSIGSGR